MSSGFLPARGSLMLDLIAVAMLLVSVVMLVSVGLVRYGKRHRLHRAIQTTLAMVLLVAIVGFEIDLRLFTDWRKLAEPSPWYPSGWVDRLLWLHLAFAIPTPLVWGVVVWQALRHYSDGFADPRYRARHRMGGRIAVILMLLTALTGWTFYCFAFVAK
jgi:uncharacterized membrane protein YozB (DUF420 family)